MIILNRIVPTFDSHTGSWKNSIVPTLLPDSFWISAGLKYDFVANTVTKNNRVYQLNADVSMKLPTIEEWLATEGNRIRTSYYNNVTADNISGHDNIQYREFIDANNVVMYKIKYRWDAKDRVISEEAMPCEGNDIINPEAGDPEAVYTLRIMDPTNPHVPEGGNWTYQYKHGTFVKVETLRKEIEATRADENMKLKFDNPDETFKYEFPEVIEMLGSCAISCTWIPAN